MFHGCERYLKHLLKGIIPNGIKIYGGVDERQHQQNMTITFKQLLKAAHPLKKDRRSA
jgi:hypothetical protein